MKLPSINYSVNALKLNPSPANKNVIQTKTFQGNSKSGAKVAEGVSGIVGELLASLKTLLGFKISANSVAKSTLNKTV